MFFYKIIYFITIILLQNYYLLQITFILQKKIKSMTRRGMPSTNDNKIVAANA